VSESLIAHHHSYGLRGVRVLEVTSLGNVLAEWGEHEAQGRFTHNGTVPPRFLDQFTGQERRLQAIGLILQTRTPVIAAIFAATPLECIRIDVTEADLPSILVMGAKP
jgi:hypothetical protein